MRIRRNASKLLGSPFYLRSSSSDFACNEVEDSTGIACELSSNPWDLLEFEEYISCNNASNLKEEDEDGGILGNNAIIIHDVVEPISTCLEEALPSITKSELTSTIEVAPVKKKRGRKKKSNNEETKIVENETNNTTYNKKYCKKTDGKGWYCKREVEHPHTLCSYHKEQLRTYTTTHSLIKSTCNATEKIDESSSLYYYYDGFGPCNGKRREKVESQVVVYEKEEQGVDEEEEEENNSNPNIAGDDEYDNDVLDFYGDDNGDKDYCNVRGENVKEMENLKKGKKKKVPKKRGRKPIKARSLKSLL